MVVFATNPTTAVAASQLDGPQRQQLAVAALAGDSISELARQNEVSRKFVYRQKEQAQRALEESFTPSPADEKVLFDLPVTKKWLYGLVLGLLLTCRSSFRGVQELLADHFGYSLSLGTIHNLSARAVEQARAVNQAQDLSAIHYGAPDEIFQSGKPVLVGVDLQSTYCYLLEAVEHRDADTWALALWQAQEQGLQLQSSVADGGQAIRAGQRMVWPDVPCDYDHFHALQETERLVTYLENRAYRLMGLRETLEGKMARARRQGQGREFSARLGQARQAETAAIALADDVACLLRWLRQDILPPRGPDFATRRELLDWVVEELRRRESQCAHRLAPVRKLLENHRHQLLAYVERLDAQLAGLAQEFGVLPAAVRAVWNLECLDAASPQYGLEAEALRCRLGGVFYGLQQAMAALRAVTFRSSSWVENINRRLRNYFFLRGQIGPDYLELLQFYFNHHRYARSAVPSRVGKSPAELLTGQPHPHWLSLLGYPPHSDP
jgi:hypothetical protein